MKRWNGWGEDAVSVELQPGALDIVAESAGAGKPGKDVSVDKILENVPTHRLPSHPLISTEARARLDHAHGQGVKDILELRFGTFERFPDGVAQPESVEELEEILEFADAHKIVVIPYGGGTSTAGQLSVPEDDRPVLSLSMRRLNRMTDLDPINCLASFEPGISLSQIEKLLQPKGFTLGHFPDSFEFSSLGGCAMTCPGGMMSAHYGGIRDLFAGGKIITPGGDIHMRPTPGPGPDLKNLIVGSEGRMGVLTEAVMKISPLPETDKVCGVFFPVWAQAVEAARVVAESGILFSELRVSDPAETGFDMAMAGPDGLAERISGELRERQFDDARRCFCLIGFIGDEDSAETAMQKAFSIFKRNGGVAAGTANGETWRINRYRRPYLRNTLWDSGYIMDTVETVAGWENVSSVVGAMENSLQTALKSENAKVFVRSCLANACRTGVAIRSSYVLRRAKTEKVTTARLNTLRNAVCRAIAEAGGPLVPTRGVGADYTTHYEKETGIVAAGLWRRVFSHIDPDHRMNPGKLVL